jgi:DNA-binding beta-propeller fold protein YncE
MLLAIDTTLGPEGFPRNQLVSGVEICPQASRVALADEGRGERAYVTCFRDGQVWVIDPAAGAIEAIVNVGRGPHALGVAADRRLLLVANFLEDTVSVIDLAPGSATENQVVLRLGRPRQEGGE